MSNNTASPPNYGLLVFGAVGYIVLGLIFGISNALIGISILKYSALRSLNQYILLTSLAFADAASMFGFAAAGVSRLLAVLSGRLDTLLSATECLTRVQVLLWMTGTPFASLMLAILSADRLFLVSFPETYLLSLPSPAYALSVVGAGGLVTLLFFLIGVAAALTKDQTPSLHVFCYLPNVHDSESILSQIYVFYFENIMASLALLSVFIFVAVPPIYKLRNFNSVHQTAQQAASQHHMTMSLAISCICTLCLYCIPMRLGFYAWGLGHELAARCMFLLSMSNCFANLFIYQLRHKELKTALKGLLIGKNMPPTLALWQTNHQGMSHNAKRAAQSNKDVLELKSVDGN